MGWSLPPVDKKVSVQGGSPWVYLLIIVVIIIIAALFVIIGVPLQNISSYSTEYWLALSLRLSGFMLFASMIYSLWWEIRVTLVWNWNQWQRNMCEMWYQYRSQYRVLVDHEFIGACGPSANVLVRQDPDDLAEASHNLWTDQPVTPGINRFGKISGYLLMQMVPKIRQRYPAGPLKIVIQTSVSDQENERALFLQVSQSLLLPWQISLQFQSPESAFSDWNQLLSGCQDPILLLAMHYRQPQEKQPEFGCAFLLHPPTGLVSVEAKNALRLFRAMPIELTDFAGELQEFRGETRPAQQRNTLFWFSGLPKIHQLSIQRILNELQLPLDIEIGNGGIIDYDSHFANYGALAGWAMVATAAQIAITRTVDQWLVLAIDQQAWGVMLTRQKPLPYQDSDILLPPVPVGSLMLAMFINTLLGYWLYYTFPERLFSWTGLFCLMISLAVTLSGIPFLLRKMISRIQYPSFIKAAQQSTKEYPR